MRVCAVAIEGKRGWGAAGKHIVLGLYQRNGQVMTFPVPDRKTGILIPLVFEHMGSGSLSCPDDWHVYTWLSIKGNHVVVKKQGGMPALPLSERHHGFPEVELSFTDNQAICVRQAARTSSKQTIRLNFLLKFYKVPYRISAVTNLL